MLRKMILLSCLSAIAFIAAVLFTDSPPPVNFALLLVSLVLTGATATQVHRRRSQASILNRQVLFEVVEGVVELEINGLRGKLSKGQWRAFNYRLQEGNHFRLKTEATSAIVEIKTSSPNWVEIVTRDSTGMGIQDEYNLEKGKTKPILLRSATERTYTLYDREIDHYFESRWFRI